MPRILLTITALGSLLLAGCDVGYLARGAYEEGRILWRRQPISGMLSSGTLDAATRAKLQLTLKVREFARDQLGLRVGGAYSTFSEIDSDAITWVLMAAARDSLTSYEWWFPVVGSVPYRGYFHESQARAEANRLEENGFDTFVRPSVAFSSLGFFSDPLLSNLVGLDRVVLASVLIHELFHRTYFLASNVMFDESAANWVGSRGAIEFFAATEGPNSEAARRAREVLDGQLRFAGFLRQEDARLLDLYQSRRPRNQILSQRATVFEQIKSDYARLKPSLPGLERYDLDKEPLNNAVFISYRIYFHDQENFEALARLHHGDVRATIAAIIELAKSNPDDPFFAIWQAAQGAEAPPKP